MEPYGFVLIEWADDFASDLLVFPRNDNMKKALGWVGAVALQLAGPAWADDQYRSFLFQNDLFIGQDGGGYTNGVFFTQIAAPSAGATQVEPSWLLQSVAPLLGLPGATLTAASIGQIMVTPRDITTAQPDRNDAPYAGALVFRSVQVHVHDDMAEILAFSVGVVGPASGAAQTQRLAHRIFGADRPRGWDTQVPNKALLGMERYRAWRFASDARLPGGADGDLIVLGGGALGNLQSSAGVSMTVRYGRGLERSFPAASRLGVQTADPVLIGAGWFGFATLSADRLFHYVGIGSDAPVDNESQLRRSRFLAAVGFAYGWENASLSFSVQSANPVVQSSRRAQTYGSLTYTYRLK